MKTNLGSGPMRLLGLGVLLAWCPAALAQSEMNVPLFLSNSDGMGRQGFVRIINHSGEAGMVTVTATDDAGMSPDPVTLALGARETKHFNSDDLEMNDRDRLSGGVGNPTSGYWRLQISTELDGVEALAYVRTTADGFLTSMHDRVRGRDMDGAMMHHVRVFNPGSNANQQSMLRLVNPMADDASVTITGLDDAGGLGEADVGLTLPAGQAMMLSAKDLEAPASGGRTGALGDGAGKWQLFVSADQAIWVMSLMGTPTGHLTNLSTATSMMDYLPLERSDPPPPDPGGMSPGSKFRDCAECPELVVVPAGMFMMGAPESEAGSESNERPVHAVSVPSFAAGVYEVTFAEWDACLAAGGCGGYSPGDYGWGRDRRPVVAVSWEDAQLYLEWLSDRAERRYRLLSESEWEYAARAGTTGPFHTGSTISTDQANYDGSHTYGGGVQGENRERTLPVGSFPANGFGLHDVHGNVFEWVRDCWNDDYLGAPSDGSAWESGRCDGHVLRGGSYDGAPRVLRTANRRWVLSGDRHNNNGFRVATTL